MHKRMPEHKNAPADRGVFLLYAWRSSSTEDAGMGTSLVRRRLAPSTLYEYLLTYDALTEAL